MHVRTHFDAISMQFPNMDMRLNNFDLFPYIVGIYLKKFAIKNKFLAADSKHVDCIYHIKFYYLDSVKIDQKDEM